MAPQALKDLLKLLAREKRETGNAGEALACEHLKDRGYEVLERNFRCRAGEVDIVARQGDVTVFVEVKERRTPRYGEGYEAVTLGKRRRVIRAARFFAGLRGLGESALRFDVISIDRSDGRPKLRHDQNAFDASGG